MVMNEAFDVLRRTEPFQLTSNFVAFLIHFGKVFNLIFGYDVRYTGVLLIVKAHKMQPR